MSRPQGHLSSREYADHAGVVKSRVSAWIASGMPHVEGVDDHGRLCKFIDPDAADDWRAGHLTPKLDPLSGEMRGVVRDKPREPSADPPPAAAGGGDATADGAQVPAPGSSSPSRVSRPPAAGGGGDAHSTSTRIQEARAALAEDQAIGARLRRLQAQGLLLDRQAQIDAFLGFVNQVAVTIDRMAADNATRVANDLGVEEHPAYMALKRVGVRIREDLATYAELERNRLGVEDVLPDTQEGVVTATG